MPSDFKIIEHESFLELLPKEPTLLDKIGQGLLKIPINSAIYKKEFHGDSIIHTNKDKDVFQSLMFRIYRIKFSFD